MKYMDLEELKNKEKFNAFICRRLGDVRKRANLTQDELSKKIGMTKNHMSAIERGVTNVTLQIILQYCYYCDAQIEDFFIPTTNRTVNQNSSIPFPTQIKNVNDNVNSDTNVVNVVKTESETKDTSEHMRELPIDVLRGILLLPQDERRNIIAILKKQWQV